MWIATRLVEMELAENKVLEKLNKVSTAKRQAYMVSGPLPDGPYSTGDVDIAAYDRSYTIRSLGRGKMSTERRQPESGQLDKA